MTDEERSAERRAVLSKRLADTLAQLTLAFEVLGDAIREAEHATKLLRLEHEPTEKDDGS